MRNQVFICYSKKDERWRDDLITMLAPLHLNNAFSVWYDGQIKASEQWRQEIDQSLAKASVAVLLASPDFLDCEFINQQELPYLLKAAEKKDVILIWILIRPCLYETTPLNAYQAAYDTSKALSELSSAKRERALHSICVSIKEAFDFQLARVAAGQPTDTYHTVNSEVRDVLSKARNLLELERVRSKKTEASSDLGRQLDKIEHKWKEQTFQVAVIAQMKAGKSTLINAWLGASVLPSSNIPQTARVVRIRHEATAGISVLYKGVIELTRGDERVNGCLRNLNNEARIGESRDLDDDLVVTAPIFALKNVAFEGQKFEILDTPGPNEQGADHLRQKVTTLLSNVDVVVFLLDYTRLKTKDDEHLFNQISTTRKDLLLDYEQRLFFVVNKIDKENRNGLSQTQTAQYVLNLLHQQIPGLEIELDHILLVSAEEALLARLVESGNATLGELKDFARIWLGKRVKEDEITLQSCRQFTSEALTSSRMLELESAILTHIYSKRIKILTTGVLENFIATMIAFQNHLKTASGTLRLSQQEGAEALLQMKRDLAGISPELDALDQTVAGAKDELTRWVKSRVQAFGHEVNETIARALEEGEAVASGDKSGLVELVKKLVGVREGSQDKETVLSLIERANREIAAYLLAEFLLFQKELESEAWRLQERLFAQLKIKIEPIYRRIEGRIEQHLPITLCPVKVVMPQISLDEFHNTVEQTVQRFVRTTQHQHFVKQTKRVEIEPEGWCSSATFDDVESERLEMETRYALSFEHLRRHWHSVIKERTEVSSLTAKEIVVERIAEILQEIRSDIKSYGDSYIEAIETDIKVTEQNESTRQAHLREVETNIDSVARLIWRIQTLSKRL